MKHKQTQSVKLNSSPFISEILSTFTYWYISIKTLNGKNQNLNGRISKTRSKLTYLQHACMQFPPPSLFPHILSHLIQLSSECASVTIHFELKASEFPTLILITITKIKHQHMRGHTKSNILFSLSFLFVQNYLQ